MISLDRLLDGLCVSVDNVVLYDLRGDEPRARGNNFSVHYPASGGGIFEMAGGAVIRFEPDKVTVFPPRPRGRGNGDAVARRPARRNGPTEGARSDRPTGEKDVRAATGRLRASYLGSVGLFDQLREPLVQELCSGDRIARSFCDLLEEIATPRPGRRVMMESLLRQSIVLLLRRCCGPDGRISWLAALDDAGIGRAVSAMRDEPEHAFTLQALAEVAGMSRSVFAARFTESLERPPMEFLKEVRLERAAELLARTDLPVKAVAARVGYSSRSSFSRAFLASHHVGPTAFRVEGREPELEADPAPAPRRPVRWERRKGERRRPVYRRTASRAPAH